MSTLVFDAISFAVQAHSGQYRKGTRIPYIVHPLGAAKNLIECGCDDEIVAAAVLHDTVEDTGVTLDQLRTRFGERVASLVRSASEQDKSDTWENRKRHTIEYLKKAPMDEVLVSAADKLDNIRAIAADHARIGEALWARFNRSKESQAWYYSGLAEAFLTRVGEGPGDGLFREFASMVKAVFRG